MTVPADAATVEAFAARVDAVTTSMNDQDNRLRRSTNDYATAIQNVTTARDSRIGQISD